MTYLFSLFSLTNSLKFLFKTAASTYTAWTNYCPLSVAYKTRYISSYFCVECFPDLCAVDQL